MIYGKNKNSVGFSKTIPVHLTIVNNWITYGLHILLSLYFLYIQKTSAILSNTSLGPGQQVLSHIPVGKGGTTGGITTQLTHQQLLQLQPQFQQALQVCWPLHCLFFYEIEWIFMLPKGGSI